jgi:hypothetical protein
MVATGCTSSPPRCWAKTNCTPRIAFLRLVIALLELQPEAPFLGQLKTLLTGPELPVSSDVAVPRDIASFIESIRPKLPSGSTNFLTALAAVLNDRRKLPELEKFSILLEAEPLPIDGE